MARGDFAWHLLRFDPQTGEPLPNRFAISSWPDCETALAAADVAARQLRATAPAAMAGFLEAYADAIAANADAICAAAHAETALPIKPRLASAELPRTTNQLRQAAAAAREGSWSLPTIDSANNIRSYYAPIGPVLILGPNNFPLAFNSVSGGDFAAAIAAGNPVIAKAHPCHPNTTRLLFEQAVAALAKMSLPPATIQLLYHVEPADGLRMIGDRRLAAAAFTGSRDAGLALKAAGDAAGKPIFVEMSSINPVVILPEALHERFGEVVDQFCTSSIMGAGQFCTNPGIVFLLESDLSQKFIAAVAQRFRQNPAGTLLSSSVREGLTESVAKVIAAGAELVTGGRPVAEVRFAFENTLLTTDGREFLRHPEAFQTEMFGTATLVVSTAGEAELLKVLSALEGNLTGTIYAAVASNQQDSRLFEIVAGALRPKVGRLIVNKMPTGVLVSPAMNHGGPFPSTGNSGFTAVGIPASLRRFAALQCFDQVGQEHLPPALRDQSPNGQMWRCIDGQWTRDNA